MNSKLTLGVLIGLLVVAPGCSFFKNEKKEIKETTNTEIVIAEEEIAPENPMTPSEETMLK